MRKFIIKLETNEIHHLIPSIHFTIGNNCFFFRFNFLFIELCIKFLYLDIKSFYKDTNNAFVLYTPTITLFQNNDDAVYKFRFEIQFYDYFYRKSFCKQHDVESEINNTKKFVHVSWLDKFKSKSVFEKMTEIIKEFNKKLKDEDERHKDNM